ncbi:hypothetical protein B0H66DRAFT_151814 [Apodospora peruviana]|uniref:Uncharacterized protein n=1 Tax=Apodospora peruviana TaxID=516989 RepID=A0AAE0IJV2_9PEZI|nr:hypothetical protein B0H66DRAFT_151814 [Apodospora peruviana]
MLLRDAPPLAAMLGMCGWLPFRVHLDVAVSECERGVIDGNDAESFDPFERADDETSEPVEHQDDPSVTVVRVLRQWLELDDGLPVARPSVFDTPVFLGHGTKDDKIHVVFGSEGNRIFKGYWHQSILE